MANNGNGSASLKREGTMQRTVREAKEYSYGCKCGEMEGEHDHDQETGKAVAKPIRQSTMEKTAQEGIQFLKDQGKDKLLETQGLVALRSGSRQGQLGTSDEDGNEDEEDEEDDTTEPTGGADDDDGDSSGENDQEEVATMKKQRTMLETAKEGQHLLENYMGGKPDPNARTRGQQKNADREDDRSDRDEEPDAKRPRRTHTMLETSKEAEQLISNPHSIGGTRSETAAVKFAEQEKKK